MSPPLPDSSAGVTPTGNSATPFLRPHVPLLALPFGVARLEEAAHEIKRFVNGQLAHDDGRKGAKSFRSTY